MFQLLLLLLVVVVFIVKFAIRQLQQYLTAENCCSAQREHLVSSLLQEQRALRSVCTAATVSNKTVTQHDDAVGTYIPCI